MIGRIPARLAAAAAAALAAVAAIALTAASAGATLVYDNQPSMLPGNVVSVPFEAASTSEFGGLVGLAGTARKSPSVSVVLSSWACQNLEGGSACTTTPGTTFNWPITLNVYELGAGNEPGAKIASVTQTVAVPFRPSANNKRCTPNAEGAVGWGKNCFHGKAFKVTFELPDVTLPNEAIVSVAYNTTDYGYAPTHSADIGEDSLNVGITETPTAPSVGTDPLPEDGYVNSSWSNMYGGLGTLGTFSLAGPSGYLEGLQPLIKVKAKNH